MKKIIGFDKEEFTKVLTKVIGNLSAVKTRLEYMKDNGLEDIQNDLNHA